MKLSSFIKELQKIEKSCKDIEILVERPDPCSNEYTCLDPYIYLEPYVYVRTDGEKAKVIISADD